MRLLLLLAALLVSVAAFGTTTAGAVVEVPFATQAATSARGGVAIAANTLMTCPEAAANCLESRAGTATGAALNNNAYAMERVDIDGDLTTFDSSTAARCCCGRRDRSATRPSRPPSPTAPR